jgi:hypothetical protein
MAEKSDERDAFLSIRIITAMNEALLISDHYVLLIIFQGNYSTQIQGFVGKGEKNSMAPSVQVGKRGHGSGLNCFPAASQPALTDPLGSDRALAQTAPCRFEAISVEMPISWAGAAGTKRELSDRSLLGGRADYRHAPNRKCAIAASTGSPPRYRHYGNFGVGPMNEPACGSARCAEARRECQSGNFQGP